MPEKYAIRTIVALLLAAVILVPFVFFQQMMDPFIILKTAVFQSLAGFIVLLWVALAIRSRAYRPRITPLTATLFALLLVITASSLLGGDVMRSMWSTPIRTIGIVALWIFGFFYLALASLAKRIPWRAVFSASLGVAALISLGALFSFVPGIDQFFLNQGGVRPGATFGNPTFLAGYLLFHVFVALWLLVSEPARGARWYAAACGGLALLGIFRTETRGDLLGVLGGLGVFAFILALRRLRPFSFTRSVFRNGWLLTIIVALVLGGAFFATRTATFWERVPGVDRLNSFAVTKSELQDRFYAWGGALKAFTEKPVLGYGWENFNLAFEKHYDPRLLTNTFDETYWDKPHDILIEYLVTGGAIGFLAYLAVWGAFLYEIGKARRAHRLWLPVFLGLAAAYFLRNLVIFDTIGTYLMFFIVAAFVDGRYRAEVPVALSSPAEESRPVPIPLAIGAIVLAALPVYFLNWQMVRGAADEYWGPNFYLNGRVEDSLASFNAALKVPTPYRDDTRITFANVVRQAYDDGISYPDIQSLQARLTGELQTVIRHDPQNYLNYAVLAEFKNSFSGLDAKYLKDAEALEDEARSLSPNRQQIYYVMAKTKIIEGDYSAAYQDFQTAVNLNPMAGDPHFYFGLLAYQVGNAEKGKEEIATAESMGRFPRTVDEAITLANESGDVGHDYDAAVRYYQMALGMNPSDQQAQEIKFKMALAYFFGNRYPEAKAAFTALGASVEYRRLTIFQELKPILDELGVRY